MSLFTPPPPPPILGPVNSTLPLPHAPIAAQGTSVPPSRSAMFAVTMAVLVASWPADLEPRLVQKNAQQNKIAPLTLAYGQQPPARGPLTTVHLQQLVAAWPPDGPLPPRGQSISWMPSVIAFVPGNPSWKIQPAILQANQDEANYDVAIVPIVVGAPDNPDQPPRQFALSRASTAITVQAWQPDVVTPQAAPKVAAWTVPPIVSVFVPRPGLPAFIYAASHLPDPLPVQRLRSVVPTFPTVSQPTPQPPLSVVELAQIVATWQQTWDAQTAPKSAAWNIPPIVSAFVPRTPLPALIWTAWEPPYVAPPRPVTIAPLTLTYGSQPVQAPLSAATRIILSSWPPDLEPRLDRPNAERVRIAPLTLVYGSQPPVQAPLSRASRIALQSWPADLEPRLGRPNAERVRIAPLTLVYGNPPTPHGPLSSTLLRILTGSWLTDASATRAARTVVASGGPVASLTVGVIHLTGSNQPSISLTGQGCEGVFDPVVFDPTVFDTITGNTIALTGSYQPSIVLTGSVE